MNIWRCKPADTKRLDLFQECYEMMSSQIQNSLVSDCIAAMGTDDFDKLGKNIELICETKKSMVKPLDLTTREY